LALNVLTVSVNTEVEVGRVVLVSKAFLVKRGIAKGYPYRARGDMAEWEATDS
jgi:hypothetical protein